MLFYEPKFPKSYSQPIVSNESVSFSALLRAEIPKIPDNLYVLDAILPFQCSSTSRNSQNFELKRRISRQLILSVLFYEPKFPKFTVQPANWRKFRNFQCSSTSRNSQNLSVAVNNVCPFEHFQCSSTSRNSQNLEPSRRVCWFMQSFSALLRAEIPKIQSLIRFPHELTDFQCSSTSRNSQNLDANDDELYDLPLSVLFYEPKFPKSSAIIHRHEISFLLSVLFYEPKFPKFENPCCKNLARDTFSALLRAEIPKMYATARIRLHSSDFQCSSTSRNSQNDPLAMQSLNTAPSFSALLRAEIPKISSP